MRRFLRWLLKLLGLLKGPSDATLLEYDEMNGRLNWKLPIPTATQRPLSHTRVEGRPKGAAEWGVLNPNVPAPTATLLIPDMSRGDWELRVIVVDTAGAESKNPLVVQGTIPFDGPSDATDVTFVAE